MARMKGTGVDSRGKPPAPPPQQVESSSGGDEETRITYSSKGKRKTPSARPPIHSDKAAVGGPVGGGEGGSRVTRQGGRTGPSPSKKVKRAASSSPSAGSWEGASDGEASEQQELRTPRKRKKKGSGPNGEYTEEDCRRELHKLGLPSARPPLAMSEDIFYTSCGLPRDGLNPHRLKMDKDVPLADVEALFGTDKGRNGFLISERLTPALQKEVESLYCRIYQKTQVSTHVGKELAMGWTLQTKGHDVNWAGFAAETNLGQRRQFAVRVKTWLTRIAALQKKSFAEVAATEALSKYLDVKVDKIKGIQLFREVHEEDLPAADVKALPPTSQPSSLSAASKAERYVFTNSRSPMHCLLFSR